MKILGIIPARYTSTRFPGKPLVEINGKSMIRRVYEQARQCPALSWIVVATDDSRIFDHVSSFSGEVVMTHQNHKSGTERCSEAAQIWKSSGREFEAIINIQGDEPFIHPEQINQLAVLMHQEETNIGTLVKRINSYDELIDSNVVKVVLDNRFRALYFSRSAIPYIRHQEPKDWHSNAVFYKHIGIYGFRSQILYEIAALNPSPLETVESLEQLRWMEHGYAIISRITELDSISIDTPSDLLKLTNKV
jgi:3-deoxy-manno-octulosonate cytidylyltransferase (CMP-KDO synthetase)